MARIAMTLAVPDLTGASRMLYYYASALVKSGHEVIVVHGTEFRNSSDSSESIISRLNDSGVQTRLVKLLGFPIPPFVLNAVKNAIGRCDLVAGFNQRDRAVAVHVAKILNVPGILSIQNSHTFWGPLFIPKIKKMYYIRSIKQNATRLVCSSGQTMQEAIDFGMNPEKCTLLRNGIELNPLNDPRVKKEIRKNLGVSADTRVFVNVGRLDRQKGQDLLIRAWSRRNRDVSERSELWLIGDSTVGPQFERSRAYKSELEKMVAELDQSHSVKFLGWRDNIHDFLAAADVYVHSARWEGFPLAIMEAMDAGLPVIMTDCSGPLAGFVNMEHGYVVHSGSDDALLDAIDSLNAVSGSELIEMGKRCRKYCASEFDIKIVGDRFVDIVEKEIEKWAG